MAYKIDNAIIKKNMNGGITLIDPENVFINEDAFIAIKSDAAIVVMRLENMEKAITTLNENNVKILETKDIKDL